MWSYYGSKQKLAKHYPKPEYDLIIEPFAGAAWYSVLHRHNTIVLNEIDETIYNLWDWLIHDADSKEIESYSNFCFGDSISHLHIDINHKNLIGFCINRGSSVPKKTVSRRSCQSTKQPEWASTTYSSLRRIAKLLPEIEHWSIQYGDYSALDNVEATWFIDPPYKSTGHYYRHNKINYKQLADWCKSRNGQVIVCENSDATWLPFQPLSQLIGQRKKTLECIWTNR